MPINELQFLTTKQAWHYRVVPYLLEGNILSVYCEQEIPSNLKSEIVLLTGCNVEYNIKKKSEIENLLCEHYPRTLTDVHSREYTVKEDSDFLSDLLVEANELRSSDIHIEKYRESARIRFRIDGKLIERFSVLPEQYNVLINKLKIRSSLDISEKRLPQDGRISVEVNSKKIDLRVSVVPTLQGEKIVLRILSSDLQKFGLESIGLSPTQLKLYRHAYRQKNGIILISGPTGSGKTTTLYATLKELNKSTENILTIEDPIEYTLDGINQVQLKESIGLTFAKALKSFLRQDPDIIMLGEIRDKETAEMAIRASLTGHLVLSTIHTNSAWGTIARLIDMGIPPYMLSSSLRLSVAQRLLRLLCQHCKEEVNLSELNIPSEIHNEIKEFRLFKGMGCNHCYNTGFSGRKAIYEMIPINKEIKRVLSSDKIPEEIQLENFQSLSDGAKFLLSKGLTTFEEVYPFLID